MRIIGGKHKGRKIFAPKNLPVRPTTDITKESLFNMLQNRFFFDEISVLDLFSGTGNIVFEFASRGTPEIVAVDKHPGSISFIRKTAKQLSLPIQTVQSDVFTFLNYPSGKRFDIIFADPPYQMDEKDWLKLIDAVFDNHWLADNGIFILEHHKTKDFSKHPNFVKSKKYGQTRLSVFENK